MADSKITALTAISTVDPTADPLVIVDVSDTSMAASGTTKKSTINQLLGSGGTATLASATITGDLTVRTNKLAVTSTNVGIGTASPTIAAGVGLEIENAGITTLRLQNTSGANAFELQVDSDANGVLYRGYNNSPHVFYVNNSTAMTLNASGLNIANGNVILGTSGKGIDFSATSEGSGTMTSELLNDYEEGTWTIGLTFGTGSTGITTATNTGRYTKIGRQVTVSGYLSLSNKGSSTGIAEIQGLPFTIANANEAYSAANVRFNGVSFADIPISIGAIGSTKILLQEITNAGAVTDITDADFTNTSSCIIGFTYTV